MNMFIYMSQSFFKIKLVYCNPKLFLKQLLFAQFINIPHTLHRI